MDQASPPPHAHSSAPADGAETSDPWAECKTPPMRVVTKGWWVLKEERVPLEVLEEEERQARSRK